MNIEEIVKELRLLQAKMFELGTAMDYYGGFSEIGEHGRELIAGAKAVETWIHGIENEGAE